MYHEPVLKDEVIADLNIKKGFKYIDATLGDGGHTLEILKQGGIVLGIDVNDASLNRAIKRINEAGFSQSFFPGKGNFEHIADIANSTGFNEVSGILFDLGYSSYQLDEGQIGLSFLRDAPLDMRLNSELGVTAADLVNSLSENELTLLIKNYSDEQFAKKFAKEIIKSRSLKKIQTTKQLADILSESSPGYEHGRIHPATRTFQALRIVVNDELGNLERSLPRAARLLLPGGRMLVISFHSLEDRIVKQFGNQIEKQSAKRAQPWLKVLTKKPIEPTELEVHKNVRSRSAKLRVFEKL